jgi:RHS repeat-associated protein
VTTFLYDALNQLTEARQGSATVLGFVYDLNGNLVKRCEGGTVTRTDTTCTGSTVTDLTYDALNRTTQVAKTGLATQTYGYDDQGRRLQKSVGGVATNYLYTGEDIHATYGATWTAAAARYTHGPNTDDPILRTVGTTTHYFHADGLGSIVALTSATGAIEASARYDAWGNRIASTGTQPIYGYTGREPDETGLIYYRARYYDPVVGRFTQRDPLGLAGALNAYAYVDGNPVTFTDPMGLEAINPVTAMNAAAARSYVAATPTDFPLPAAGGASGLASSAEAFAETSTWPPTGLDYVARLNDLAPEDRAGLNEAICVPCAAVAAPVVVAGAMRAAPHAQRLAQQAGLALQRAHGFVTQNVQSVLRPGAVVRSDQFDPERGIIGEIKKVPYQALTQQLREYIAIARKLGLRFELHAPGAKLSGPLHDAITRGDIVYVP